MVGSTQEIPHLRKSGSRSVVSDCDEQLLYADENCYSHSMETKDFKNTGGPTSAIAKVLPPVLTVLSFLIWVLVCCKTGWKSVMRMSDDSRHLFLYETFLYYNPPLLVAMMVWLWGVNLWVFSQSGIDYAKIFNFEPNHLTHKEIWKCARWMTIAILTSMTAYLYLYSNGEVSLAASQPVFLYIVAVMILICPFNAFYSSSRYFLLRTLCRILIPLQLVTFSDFFLADILTSMSKVFSDLERSVCRMVHRQVATIAWFEADSVCGSHSVAIPLVLVLPYLFRLFQCIRQYKYAGERDSLFNAAKYATSVPVVVISALKYHIPSDTWTNFFRHAWICSGFVNSLYSFFWDVTRDWDLRCFTRAFKFSRPNFCSYILYGRTWTYCWVIGSNLILRCLWTYKLSAHLRHNHITVFVITALEIFRRFQWAFFRIENEWNKINQCRSISHFHVHVAEDQK